METGLKLGNHRTKQEGNKTIVPKGELDETGQQYWRSSLKFRTELERQEDTRC